MNDLLPPNATAPERALSEAVQRIGDVPVIVKQVWNPTTCPPDLLPWLAWAMSVDEWDVVWNDAQKREAVRQSMRIHEKKGTVDAVKRAINAVFGSGSVVEWWEFGGQPHTFKVQVKSQFPNVEAYKKLIRLVNAAKPLRSHITGIQVVSEANLNLYVGFYNRNAAQTTVFNRMIINGADLSLKIGFAHHIATTTAVSALTD